MSDNDIRELIDAAVHARESAHAPYSDHPVGAALRTANGNIYSGCNVENAAYPLSRCAEEGAVAAMVRGGDKDIVEVVVVGPGEDPCTPCGGCRQVLFEFGKAGTRVYICNAEGILRDTTLDELLPYAFSSENLPVSDEGPADI